MELKERFDDSLNYLYKYKNLENKVYDDILIEEDNDLQRFMTGEGEKIFYELINEDLSIDTVKLQNSFLKNESADMRKDVLYESAINILLKNDSGFLNRKEYNTLALAYFAIGVDKAIRNYYRLKFT